MPKKLVIVESPGKVKTIQKYLGPQYIVRASVGHCYEIDKKDGAIDVDNNYAPKYVVSTKKRNVVKQLQAISKTVDEVYIASDPDREGEAIGWHIAHRALKCLSKTKRIVFHEITKSAVLAALKNPGTLNEDLYHAQQARAVLDRLVGYKVSPILWRKVCKGTSAGRVQSIGLRIIVDRHREIEAFDPEEYWTIDGLFNSEARERFKAAYVPPKDKIRTELQAMTIKKEVEAHDGKWNILDVDKKEKRRSPYPIFNTSSLQQFCSSYFGWDGKKTMKIAQDLYEGFPIHGGDPTGLITYHRTDSTNISKDAVSDVRSVIGSMGSSYLPAKPRFYKTKAKSAQEAHEGIRPAHIEYSPADVKSSASSDHARLYETIYKRFVACQMTDAVFDTVKVSIQGEGTVHNFQANGQTLKFDGFLKMWTYSKSNDAILPELKKDEGVALLAADAEQHFTKPPAAYNTASLVKTLEEKGIGRPSTYASIVDTLLKRQYVTKEGKSFRATELGMLVSDFLVEAFPELMDSGYTARIEEQLDEIADSKRVWYESVDAFYKELRKRIDASKTIKSSKTAEETDITCPTCKKHKLVKRRGKYGSFYGCAGYTSSGKDKCKATFEIGEDGQPIKKVKQYLQGVTCDKCGSKIVIRTSKRKGTEFGGCEGYPKCHRIFSMDGMPIEPKTRR